VISMEIAVPVVNSFLAILYLMTALS